MVSCASSVPSVADCLLLEYSKNRIAGSSGIIIGEPAVFAFAVDALTYRAYPSNHLQNRFVVVVRLSARPLSKTGKGVAADVMESS